MHSVVRNVRLSHPNSAPLPMHFERRQWQHREKGKRKLRLPPQVGRFHTDRQVKRRMVVAEYAPVRRKATLTALAAWESRSVYPNQSKTTQTLPTTSLESAGNALARSQGESNASTTASSKVPHSPIRRLYRGVICAAGIHRIFTRQSGDSSNDRLRCCQWNRDFAFHDDYARQQKVGDTHALWKRT